LSAHTYDTDAGTSDDKYVAPSTGDEIDAVGTTSTENVNVAVDVFPAASEPTTVNVTNPSGNDGNVNSPSLAPAPRQPTGFEKLDPSLYRVTSSVQSTTANGSSDEIVTVGSAVDVTVPPSVIPVIVIVGGVTSGGRSSPTNLDCNPKKVGPAAPWSTDQ
jgi:ssDNA-binding replication factor A large subunit